MDEINYFQNITNTLRNSTHPEIYHFRNGNHPGSNWYLKTVCPIPDLVQIDKVGYGLLWKSISVESPNLVHIVPHAYDWNGDEIPYMASVWLNVDCDVIIKVEEVNGFSALIVDRNTGSEFYVNNLRDLIALARDNSEDVEDLNKYLGEIDELEEIADILEKETRSENAIQIRNDFKVLDGGLEE